MLIDPSLAFVPVGSRLSPLDCPVESAIFTEGGCRPLHALDRMLPAEVPGSVEDEAGEGAALGDKPRLGGVQVL